MQPAEGTTHSDHSRASATQPGPREGTGGGAVTLAAVWQESRWTLMVMVTMRVVAAVTVYRAMTGQAPHMRVVGYVHSATSNHVGRGFMVFSFRGN